MAILSALIAFLGRQAGRVLNVVFGWTTTMLFGRVPSNKQTWLSAIALGSIAWLAALLGTALPRVGAFLLAFAPIPPWVNPNWVRLAMLAAVVVLPLVIGAITSLALGDARGKGWGLVKLILRGYPYTLGLALTLVLMFVFVPFLKIPAIVRRWQDQHLPVTISADAYDDVVGDIHDALSRAGIETDRRPAPALLALPPKVLALLAGGPVQKLVAKDLTMLEGTSEPIQVILYPSDVMVRGESRLATRSRAAVVKQATFCDAYLTWSKEVVTVEEQLRELWRRLRNQPEGEWNGPATIAALRDLEHRLDQVDVDYDEWETLYREHLQVQNQVLATLAGLAERPAEAKRQSQREVA